MIDIGQQQNSKKGRPNYINKSLIEKKYVGDGLINLKFGALSNEMERKQCSAQLQSLKLNGSSRVQYNSRKIFIKKQLQAHKIQSANSIIEKRKGSKFDTRIPELKESKHKRNISVVWKSKKKQIQFKNEKEPYQPTVSLYFRHSETPFQYQLKMDVRKVESTYKAAPKKSNKSSKKIKNLPEQDETVPLSSLVRDYSEKTTQIEKQILYNKQCHKSKLLFKPMMESEDMNSIRMPQRYRYSGLKERFQKSIISTSTKKPKKTKQQIQKENQEMKKLLHIGYIIENPSYCDQEAIKLFENQKIVMQREKLENPEKKTASAFCVVYQNKAQTALKCLFEKNLEKRVQIASLTKIMTSLLILKIVKTFKLSISKEKVLVSEKSSRMPGTSAELNYSDILTVEDLLHGLMLPSGNDAAIALGEWGGKTIRKYCNLANKHLNYKGSNSKSLNFFTDYAVEKITYQKLFIYHMNKAARALNLQNTFFMNTHGLMNNNSYSTAYDVAFLTSYAMKDEMFKRIVGKKEYSCQIFNRTYSQQRKVTWINTNKLLNIDGFVGVKTGVTPAAGPCLSSMFQINKSQSIIIVVLKVKSLDFRFKQSLQLLKESLLLTQKISHEVLQNLEKKGSEKTSYSDCKEDVNTMIDQRDGNSDCEVEDEEDDLS